MSAAGQSLRLRCADGFELAADWFAADKPRACVVMAPALGVPRRFYAALAAYLAQRGLSTLTFDYRGFAGSRGGAAPESILMQHWGEQDIEAALRHARSQMPAGGKLFLIGHSAGGQLPGLAPSSATLDGLVLVAASAPHAGLYPYPARLALLTLWWLMIPALTLGRAWFPAHRTGLGSEPIAASVVRQWARWARTPGYMFNPGHRLDTTRYAQLSLPLLSYCFLDDRYAPPRAVEALLQQYPAARIERHEIAAPANSKLGHFGYFRERHRDTLWRQTADWLTRLC